MAERDEDSLDIYNLPLGAQVSPVEFCEFQAGYEVFVAKNEQFKLGYENLLRQVATANRPLIVTEGKTDWKHLKAALAQLKSDGEFTSLEIELLEYSDDVDMGDTRLSQMCEHFAKATHPRRIIFVFDRDNPKIIGSMAGEAIAGYRQWSPQVFSFCIPVPTHRVRYTSVSIEFYYKDTEIQTIHQRTGKRLFFTNEVELVQRPGKRADQVRVLASPKETEELEKKIFDEDCTRIRDANNIQLGHSKAVFAEYISTREPGFDAFGVTEFRVIFSVIESIVALP